VAWIAGAVGLAVAGTLAEIGPAPAPAAWLVAVAAAVIVGALAPSAARGWAAAGVLVAAVVVVVPVDLRGHPAHSLVARVVRHRLAQARASDSQSASASQSWVQLIRSVFKRYKLDGAWITGDVGDVGKWRETCHKAVRGELKKEWPKLAAKRSSLALYRTLKQLPYPEPYLDRSTKNREGRRLKVLLRTGVLGLMNTIGDRLRVDASSEVRQCWMCRARGMSPAPKEDALHFVVGCPALAHLREQMFEGIIPALRKKSDDLFRWFSSCTPEECLSFVVGGDMHSCRAPPRPARAPRRGRASRPAARATRSGRPRARWGRG
jgi:hypothetical protein